MNHAAHSRKPRTSVKIGLACAVLAGFLAGGCGDDVFTIDVVQIATDPSSLQTMGSMADLPGGVAETFKNVDLYLQAAGDEAVNGTVTTCPAISSDLSGTTPSGTDSFPSPFTMNVDYATPCVDNTYNGGQYVSGGLQMTISGITGLTDLATGMVDLSAPASAGSTVAIVFTDYQVCDIDPANPAAACKIYNGDLTLTYDGAGGIQLQAMSYSVRMLNDPQIISGGYTDYTHTLENLNLSITGAYGGGDMVLDGGFTYINSVLGYVSLRTVDLSFGSCGANGGSFGVDAGLVGFSMTFNPDCSVQTPSIPGI